MIIFKTFQGLENFYIKFQNFPYFPRICTNPACCKFHWNPSTTMWAKTAPNYFSSNFVQFLSISIRSGTHILY